MACAWPLSGLACLMSEVAAAPIPPHPAPSVSRRALPRRASQAGCGRSRSRTSQAPTSTVRQPPASWPKPSTRPGQHGRPGFAGRSDAVGRDAHRSAQPSAGRAPEAGTLRPGPGRAARAVGSCGGPTRIALRCTGTPGAWQVYVPVEVKVFALLGRQPRAVYSTPCWMQVT